MKKQRKKPNRSAPLKDSRAVFRAGPFLQKLGIIARVLLLVYVVLTFVVIRLHPMSEGLDSSWAVGLNYFRNVGLVHGRDIAFTYGPLSFLTLPMNMGSNLTAGAVFQVAAWVAFVAVLSRLIYVRKLGLASLATFALLAFLGIDSFHTFGYVGPDIFLAYFALLLLGGALDGRRWYGFYSAALIVGLLLMLIKWSTGMHALAAVLAFPVAMTRFDRHKALTAAVIGFVGGPIAFVISYLLYDPSFADMIRYLRAGLSLSAGYNAAMSLPYGGRDLVAALLFAGVYLAFLVWLYILRQRSFVLGVALLGPLFIEFKHSFIRPAGHIEIYFLYLPLAVGLIFLFTRLESRARWVLLMLLPMAMAVRYRSERYASWNQLSRWPSGIERAKALRQVFDLRRTRALLAAQSAAALLPDRLPPDLLARIGNASTTAFPWKCSYAAANPIRFVPFPIFASYSAYTDFLDHWNASFLQDASHAPEFVLFEWLSIDGRHPLLDVPQTFASLFQNYEFDSQFGERILLRRRASPRFAAARMVRTEMVRAGHPIRFANAGAHPIVARTHIDYNLRGRVLRFLFQIPAMRAIYASESGRAFSVRLPPEIASGGLPLNFAPSNLQEFVQLFRDGRMPHPMDSLVLTGAGRMNFEDLMLVDYYEFPDFTLQSAEPAPARPDPGGLVARTSPQSSRIEMLGTAGVTDFGPDEVIELPDTDGFVEATGWAVDQDRTALAQSVWIKLDGKLYPAVYGIERPGMIALLGNSAYRNSGFTWVYPNWKLGSSEHAISLVVIASDGHSYHEVTQRRFRVVHTGR